MTQYQGKKEVYFLSSIYRANHSASEKRKGDYTDLPKPVLVNDCSKYLHRTDRTAYHSKNCPKNPKISTDPYFELYHT